MARSFQILLHPVQADFLSSQAPFRAFVGGRGAGKSFIGAYDLLTRACAKRDRLYMVIAPTYNVLRDASMRTFVKLAMKLGKIAPGGVNRTDLRVTLDSGSQVIFRSAENPERLRGPNLSGVWMDEAQGSDEEAFSIAIACLREAGDQGFLTATFTPKGRRHWTYTRFGRNEELRRAYQKGEQEIDPELIDPSTYLFHCRTSDNPFLPAGFEDKLKRQYTSNTAEQELGGEFIEMGGMMFKREWFSNENYNAFVDSVPKNARRVRYYDKAATKGGGTFTAGALLAWDFDGTFYVEHIIHGQWAAGQRDQIIKLQAELDNQTYGYGGVRIFVEQEPGSGGKESADNSIKQLAGNIVGKDRVTGKKWTRAEPFAAQCEHQNVRLVTTYDRIKPWISDFLDELMQFPDGKFSDQVDACSGAFNMLTKGNYSAPAVAGAGARGAISGPIGAGAPAAPSGSFGGSILGGYGSGPGAAGGLRGFQPR